MGIDMKEVQIGDNLELYSYKKYDKAALYQLFLGLHNKIDKAEQSGSKDVYIQFNSTLATYEDNCPGPVEIEIRGKRELNEQEKGWQAEYIRINALASKLGVTQYEARLLDRLEKTKKVKL